MAELTARCNMENPRQRPAGFTQSDRFTRRQIVNVVLPLYGLPWRRVTLLVSDGADPQRVRNAILAAWTQVSVDRN